MHFPNRLPIFLTAACISFNLSFSGSAFGQPLTCADLDGAQVYGAESFRYLGFFGSASAEDSIMNPNTGLGSPISFNGSVRAEGVYGGQFSARSARNTSATSPPYIAKDGQLLALLTNNQNFIGELPEPIPLEGIDLLCVGEDAFTSEVANGEQRPSPLAVQASDELFDDNFALHGAIRVQAFENTENFLFLGRARPTSYVVEVAQTADGPREQIPPERLTNQIIQTVAGTFQADILGLVPGQQYHVWVTAVNAAGAAQLSIPDQGTAQYVSAGAPSAPRNATATPGTRKLQISYEPPGNDGGRPIINYEYATFAGEFCARQRGLEYTALDPADTDGSFTVDGLDNEQVYSVCFRACNIDNCGSTAEVTGTPTFTPAEPDAPRIDRVDYDQGVLTLFFTPGADNGAVITAYSVSCSGGLAAESTGSPVALAGAVEGQRYECRVSATNAIGASSASSPVVLIAEPVPNGLNLPLLLRAMQSKDA